MKKVIVILSISLWAWQLYAQQDLHICIHPWAVLRDSVLCSQKHADRTIIIVDSLIPPILFDVNKSDIRITPQLTEAINLIQDKKGVLARISIVGSASPDGSSKWNQELGLNRAEALTRYIVQKTELDSSMFHVCSRGEDWEFLGEILDERKDFPNGEHIQSIILEETDNEVRKRKIQELDGGQTWHLLIEELFPQLRNARLAIVSVYPKFEPIASEYTLKRPPMIPLNQYDLMSPKLLPPTIDKSQSSKWKIAIKTNLLFDAVLVANLGVEISPWTHWSLDIPVWYSPYNISSTRNIRLLAVQPEIRWWSKEAMNGHFVGLHTHVAGFNIALNDYARYQDPNHALWGLGVSYGYAMTLGKSAHWGLEFTLGAGFAQYHYDAYRNESNGPKFRSGSDCYWGITRAGVTLSYRWTLLRKNRKH